MNIIDRSPLKMTTQEALYSHCSRRMNEARTQEEKSSIVQNFAEQLRLEKLRAKRLQDNMRELNNTIANSSPVNLSLDDRMDSGDRVVKQSAFDSSQGKTFTSPKNSTGISPQQQPIHNCTPAWLNPYAGSFDLFGDKNGNGNGNYQYVGIDRATVDSNPITHRFSKTSLMLSDGLLDCTDISQVQSRPLNANALPFVLKNKTSITPPGKQNSGRTSLQSPEYSSFKPIVDSGRICHANAAVAPKSVLIFDRTQPPPPLEIQLRPSSTGPDVKSTVDQRQKKPTSLGGSPVNDDAPGKGIIYRRRSSQEVPPRFQRLNRQWEMNDEFGESHLKRDDGGWKSKRNLGHVRIEKHSMYGQKSSLLKDEDWDAEYQQAEQKDNNKEENVEEEREKFIPPRRMNRRGGRSSVDYERKDWVSILKEREDMENRKYSKEKLLELCQNVASQTRPSLLSPEFDNEHGLWNPDLWFHMNFQEGDNWPYQKRKAHNNNRRHDDEPNDKDHLNEMHRISCFSDIRNAKRADDAFRSSSR